MSTVSTVSAIVAQTSRNNIRHETTGCESGFAMTASRSDSLAELSRHSIFIRNFSVEGGAEITDVKPAEIVGYTA